MQKRNIVKAMVVGAALALVVPGTAYATPTVTVTTLTTPTTFTAPGNGALLQTSANCSSGLIAGGGVNMVTTSGTTQQADDIHAMETAPSPNGSTEATGTDTNVAYWLGYGGTGGHGGGTYTVQPFGVCFTNSSITSTQIVVAGGSNGPNGANSSVRATATCPMGTVLLGGGAQIVKASNQNVHLAASYPSDSSGVGASDGSTNPTSWTVRGLNGNMANANLDNGTTAFAVCSGSSSSVTVTVKHNHASGPTSADSSQSITTSACGATEGTMISGGASTSGGDPTSSWTDPASSGVHIVGDYPSDDTSNPPTPTSNNSSTTYWAAIGHTGGNSSTGTQTDVWGLCLPS